MFSIALTAFVWGFGSARKYHNATCDETTCYDIEPTTSVHGFKISLVEHCHLMPSDCLHFRYKIEEIPCRGGRKGGGKGGDQKGRFEGACNYCWQYGHRKRECPELDKVMNQWRHVYGIFCHI